MVPCTGRRSCIQSRIQRFACLEVSARQFGQLILLSESLPGLSLAMTLLVYRSHEG